MNVRKGSMCELFLSKNSFDKPEYFCYDKSTIIISTGLYWFRQAG